MKTPLHSRSGSVFVIALITLTVVATIIGVSATLTSHVGRIGGRNNNNAEAQTAAESAIEVLFDNWRTLTSVTIDPTNAQLSASSVVPTTSQWTTLHPGLAGYTLTASVEALDGNGAPFRDENGTVIANAIATKRWTFSSGPTTRRVRQRSYLAIVTAVRAGQRAVVQRVFERNDNPFFSFMMFAQKKFELHPGPKMDVVGKIHSNEGTMYLLGGGGVLRLWDYVSYVDGYAEAGSPELIANEGVSGRTLPVYGAPGTTSDTEKARLLSVSAPLEAFGRDTSLIFDSDNINAQSYRELIERPNSGDSTVQDIEDRRLYNQADLKILIDRSLIAQPDKPITDAANIDAVQVLTKSNSAVSDTVKTAVLKGISTTTTTGGTTAATKFYDAREHRFVEAVNVDIGALKTEFYDKSGTGFYAPILYVSEINRPTVNQGQGYDANGNAISRTSSVYNTIGGVRIKNARELPKNVNSDTNDSDGLVIVSENPVYVQGDFNTGGAVATDVATNRSIGSTVIPTNDKYNGTTLSANSTQRYKRVPSAIMGDAVSILSNSWNDANSFYNKTRWDSKKKQLIIDGATGLTATSTKVDVYSATGVKTTQTITRNASKSTVNAAVFSGWMISDSSQRTGSPNDKQSGGMHNFPRFLENWSGNSLTYYGSLVTLFESEQGYADFSLSYYNPPQRVWYYDPLFETQQPAGFFASTEYRRGRFYRTLANN